MKTLLTTLLISVAVGRASKTREMKTLQETKEEYAQDEFISWQFLFESCRKILLI